MYFPLRYFLSSVPSVKIFPLFTIKNSNMTITRQRRNDLKISWCKLPNLVQLSMDKFALCSQVFVVSFFSYKLLLPFCLTACFDPNILNILRKFPKGFWSWAKTSLASKYNFVGTISIFCKAAVIDSIHNRIRKKNKKNKKTATITPNKHAKKNSI